MVAEPDEKKHTFVVNSLADVEAQARQVLKEKGFSDELIEAQLVRVTRDYPDWPDRSSTDKASPDLPSEEPGERPGASKARERQ
jgi:hypothetical protein